MSFSASRQKLIPFLALCVMLLVTGSRSYAQGRVNADSASQARRQALEATRAAQKRSLDSAKAFRQVILDSLKAVRQERSESLAATRKYRESRAYRDSVTSAREDKIAAIREVQHARMDSMKDARLRITDNTIAAREAAMAPMKKAQQQRTDSLAAIKKYKTSKRYADSVAIAQKARSQEVAARRKSFSDSLTAARKTNMDALKAVRKVTTDSLTAVRKVRTDSLEKKRKDRAAALVKTKDNQLRDKKVKEKQAENKAQLAFELKIKKKRSVYSNENMLKKKWSAPRRGVQNTFTHYNYYFNAERKMAEAEANMQRTAKDKWDERIPLYSFNPVTDSTTFAGDMDSVIQKTSLGIQIHDPRTKWADDLYLLLGKAYYYKGDMDNAASSFKYIVALNERAKADAAKRAAEKGKPAKREAPSIVTPEQTGVAAVIKREPKNNEGLLWLARTYTTYGRYGDAESVLDLLGSDAKFPESLRGEFALQKGYLALRQNNGKAAASNLLVAAADKSIPDYTRRRAAFISGQLLQDNGSYIEAARQYALVSELHPKIEMDFAARRNRTNALIQAGGIQKDAIASLKSMLNDGKFSPYYEQIYYLLGRLSANAGNTTEAVSYLRSGITSAKTTRKQKAMSFATLGNVYFNTGAYTNAKSAFDSTAKYLAAAPDDSEVSVAMRRASLVDKIAVPAATIRQQDSLLALGSLSTKEQRAIVRRYIRGLQNSKADSAFRAENGGVAAAAVQDNSEAKGGDATASSWYFANPVQIQQGVNDFKRKWGNRPLIDNWRRNSAVAAAGTLATGGGDATQGNSTAATGDAAGAGGTVDENGVPTEEALMAVIPTTPEAQAIATGRAQRAMVDMATAYVRQFEDNRRATATLDTFDKRWTLNPYTAEATYLRYLIALRGNNLKDAQRWSDKLQKDFSGTQWANYVAPAPGDNADSGPALASVGEYYDATYDLLQQRQYGEVLSRTRSARRQYADEVYGNRFRIVEAMAYAGSAQYKQADTILNDFIRTHADDPLKPWAERVLSFVSERRKTDTTQSAAPNSGTSLPANLTAAAASGGILPPDVPAAGTKPVDTSSLPVPADYTFKPSEAHYFIFAVNKVEQKALGVKAGLSDLNTFRFSTSNLETSMLPMKAGRAIVAVKTFKNAGAARTYLAAFNEAKMLTREYNANEYQTVIISASNYRKLIADGGIGSYLPFYRAHY